MTDYAKLSDNDIARLMFTESDQLPMSFAQEVISRGARMIPALSDIITDYSNWKRIDAGWWAVNHACFLLGAIGGRDSVEPLVEALFHCVQTDNDWVWEQLPSIYGRLGPSALDALKRIASDPSWNWCIREKAMAGMAAMTLRHPELESEVFAFIAEIAADAEDDPESRSWAGHVLMDFGRTEHEALLFLLIESGAADGNYDQDDVHHAWARGKNLYWYQRDWLDFYSPEEIKERRRRWEKERPEEGEAKKKASADENEVEDENERENTLSCRGALKALGPDAALAQAIRELFEAEEIEDEEEENFQERLKKQNALAMELHQAILKKDAEKGTLFKRLQGQMDSPASRARLAEDEPGAFQLFDAAVGRGEIEAWLTDLPLLLADEGLPREGAELAKAWSEIRAAREFLADRAIILAENGREDEAREQIRENLKRFAEDLWVRMKAGDALRALKDLEAAEARYRESLGLVAGDHDRNAVLERLVPLLKKRGKTAEAGALEGEKRRREEEARARWAPRVRQGPKIGRNDPCPCDSGKKHKKCCLGKET